MARILHPPAMKTSRAIGALNGGKAMNDGIIETLREHLDARIGSDAWYR